MRKTRFVLAGVAVALIGVRLWLPSFVQDKANKEIAALPDYEGRVGRVQLALWRGAFSFDDFELRTKKEDMEVVIESLETSIEWRRACPSKDDLKILEPASGPRYRN